MSQAAKPTAKEPLLRAIGPMQMTLYAAGSMMGAGIYGLIGKAAGQVGSMVWASFLVALVAALLTGLSYASLASRYPKAGGAAYVTQRAFKRGLLTHVVGIATACSGLTSIAAGAWVIGENLHTFKWLSTVPPVLIALAYVVLMAGIVFRGIRESIWANLVCTFIEAGGLLLVVVVGAKFWGQADLFDIPTPAQGAATSIVPLLLVQGAALTFFAFVGFEDSINVGEEVKNPRTTLPIGILLAMGITAALYIAVAITAVSVIPWRELGQAGAPLAAVMDKAAPWLPGWTFVVITVFAVANSALVNYVTASRLLYGMARDGRLPKPLSKVHAKRHTPHVAIGVLLAIVAVLIMSGNVTQLGEATTLLLLAVFSVVNGALLVLRKRPGEKPGAFEPPAFVPALGAIVCLGLIAVRVSTGDLAAPLTAGALIAAALALYWIMKRGHALPASEGRAPSEKTSAPLSR